VRDRYAVAAPVSGRLARIEWEAGDRVAAGDRLAHLYPHPENSRAARMAQARLAAAQERRQEAAARVADAEAHVQQREREMTRAQALARDSIMSPQEHEQARLAATTARNRLRMAQATHQAATAEVDAARAALLGAAPTDSEPASTYVVAPVDGRVLRVLEESERVVTAGTPLVEMGDPASLEVVVDVRSEDAVRMTPGARVRIERWGGTRPLEGRVRRVDPEAFTEVSALGVEEQRVNVIVAPVDPPPTLGVGYRVEAHIVTWTAADVLTVPTSALFQRAGGWHVFVVVDGQAVLRPVQIGQRASEAAEVKGGLQAEDQVIVTTRAS
jgi:HlyD family secretion protein